MLRFVNTIAIHQPLDVVFAFVTDFTNIPMWDYQIKRVKQMSEGGLAKGAVFLQTRKYDNQQFVISEFIPDELVVVKSINGASPRFQRRMTFKHSTGKAATEISDVWELEIHTNQLMNRLSTHKIKSDVRENLRNLKELLETGKTELPDGRLVTR